MSILIPLPAEDQNSLLITECDIGRGYAFDEKYCSCKKKQVYNFEKRYIATTCSETDKSTLIIIRNTESLKPVFDVDGEFGLALGLLGGKLIGKYIDDNRTDSEKLTLLFSKNVVKKIVELKPNAELVKELDLEIDIDSLRSSYGLYYIRKIEYGASLNIKITLDSNDAKVINQIKGDLQGSIDIGKLKSVLSPHLTIGSLNTNSNSNVNVSSSIFMSGCETPASYVQSFEDTVKIINSFKADPNALVPVRIEISPIPFSTTFEGFDGQTLNNYKSKVSKVSSYCFQLQQAIQQLTRFSSIISQINDIDLIVCRDTLLESISTFIQLYLERPQEQLYNFLQKNISSLNNKLPYTDKEILDIITKAKRLIGSTNTKTSKGEWFGPSVDGLPIYEGTYQYSNGSTYKGQCLNGKREGSGIMTFINGNIDHLKAIEGKWKDDLLYFPSTITFTDSTIKTIQINNMQECNNYRYIYKDSIECKATKDRDAVKVIDRSNSDEYVKRITVNVDLIQDELFLEFYQALQSSKDSRDRYYFMFLGMTGTGKTTMIEFILNILTGQVHSPITLRAVSLEDKGIGESKTKSVCRYEVEYVLNGAWMFGITIIDTPGFADVGGLEKDSKHIQSILKTVGKLDRIDCVSYVVNGALTRKTLEPLKVLCNVFSILPHEAFDCVSTFITFCDNANQANDVRNVLNEMLNGIKDKPAVFIDNPWAHHLNNKYKTSSESNQPDAAGSLLGVDNTDELQTKLETKTQIIQQFIIDRIRLKKSFQPAGMSVLHQLKDELLSKLNILAITNEDLSTTTKLYKELAIIKINSLLENYKAISIDDWLKDRGYAYIDGKPKAKVMGSIPWPGGVHSTVCFAPQCLNMVCHQGCTIKFTPTKGDNVFIGCTAFNNHQNCQVCSGGCSYQQHVHVRFQLEWFENDKVLEAYESIKMGADQAIKKSKELQIKAGELEKQYCNQLHEFSKLKIKFKDLSVLGDMHVILDSTKRTYEQQYELAVKIDDQERANNTQKIIDQLTSFIEALNTAEKDTNYYSFQITQIGVRSSLLFKQLSKIININ